MVEEARKRGRLVVATAYADYRRADMEDLQLVLFQLGFRLVHCPSWPSGGTLKSVVDPIMAQDLRDTLETHPGIDVFMIGTGDRDFIPVAHSLRYHGCQVVMVASPDCANRELLACADEFVPLPASTPRVIEPMLAHRRQPRQSRGRYGQREVRDSVPSTVAATTQPVAPTPMESTPSVLPTSPVTRTEVRQAVSPTPVRPIQRPQPYSVPSPVQPAHAVSVTPQPMEAGPINGAAVSPAPLSREGVLQEVLRRQQAGEAPTPRQLARALVPDDDPDGRLRSFVSNTIADLIKEGRLIRVQARQHGRLVEAVALPGGIFDTATPQATVGPAVEVAAPSAASAPIEATAPVEPVVPEPPLPATDESTAVETAVTEVAVAQNAEAETAEATPKPAQRRARTTTRRTTRSRPTASAEKAAEALPEQPAVEPVPASEPAPSPELEPVAQAAPTEAAETKDEAATAASRRRRTRRPRAEAVTTI